MSHNTHGIMYTLTNYTNNGSTSLGLTIAILIHE